MWLYMDKSTKSNTPITHNCYVIEHKRDLRLEPSYRLLIGKRHELFKSTRTDAHLSIVIE